jgi:accessory gene regulator protein AgrB
MNWLIDIQILLLPEWHGLLSIFSARPGQAKERKLAGWKAWRRTKRDLNLIRR